MRTFAIHKKYFVVLALGILSSEMVYAGFRIPIVSDVIDAIIPPKKDKPSPAPSPGGPVVPGGSGPFNPEGKVPVQPPPIPYASPPIMSPKDASKAAEKGLDALADIITFGDHGRRRDRDRAAKAEEKSQAVRKGVENTYAEKLAGLKRVIQNAETDLQLWESFAKRYPVVMEKQEKLLKQANTALKNQNQVAANLKNVSSEAQSLKMALAQFNRAIKTIPVDKSKHTDPAAQVWDEAITEVARLAKLSNQSEEVFLSRAIAVADPALLMDFMNEVAGIRGQLLAMSRQISWNIEASKKELANLRAELATLEKKKK
ncbi:MAG TPA: hypothetical protein VGR42_00475 [Casimicrobiaceae bacterium]|jgi:hypothetical protein|nr:hypothetical protein [Casimicrobiaceae bacterium]